MYYSDVICERYYEANELTIIKKSNSLTCNVQANDGEYLVTSIPYDKGFTATINGEPVETEIVNKAFIGIKLSDGTNNIVLKYESPLLKIGMIVSFVGIVAFVFVLVGENLYACRINEKV